MRKLDQKGAVALLTVVIFAVIIAIVTVAYARSSIVQQQESINFDLSTRAYYAAETGVQDAIRKLKEDPTFQQKDCKISADSTFGRLGNSENLAYTCRLIEPESTDIAGTTQNGKTIIYEVSPKDVLVGDLSLTIFWSKSQNQSEGNGAETILAPRTDDSKLFTNTASWRNGDNQIHPLLRTGFISVDPAGGLTRDGFKQNVFFLNPTKSSPSSVSIDFSGQITDKTVTNGQCVRSDQTLNEGEGFSCKQKFTLNADEFAGAKRVFIAFTSEYGTTDFKFTLAKDRPVVLNGQAVIDVTAKAGSVFRRVQQRVPIDGNFIESSFTADALVAGDGICKLFTITNKASDYFSGCTP